MILRKTRTSLLRKIFALQEFGVCEEWNLCVNKFVIIFVKVTKALPNPQLICSGLLPATL